MSATFSNNNNTSTTTAVTKTRRIAIVGSRAVGKSSLALQFVEGQFNQSYYPTIENTFSKPFEYHGTNYQLEIMDSAGQDEFSIISYNQAIGIHSYVFVFSLTSKDSFEIIKVIREKLLALMSVPDLCCIIVANKLDLEQQRQVSLDEIKEISRQWKCPFIETSAKLNQNITKIFELSLNEIEKQENGSLGGGGGGAGDKKCNVQ